MSARYVLQPQDTGHFRFTLTTHGGQVLLTSEVYSDKDRALRHISAARVLVRSERNYEFLTAEDGLPYFVVKNARDQAIVQSETYPDPESMRTAINTIKGSTRGARLEDLTEHLVEKPARFTPLWNL